MKYKEKYINLKHSTSYRKKKNCRAENTTVNIYRVEDCSDRY